MSALVMSEPIAEASPPSTANIAGALYLTSMLTGGAAALVRWRLFLSGDAAVTATNILAHQRLFWMVSAADLISALCFVAVTLLFYDLFKPVNKGLSLLAALFSLAGLVIGTLSLFHLISSPINNLVFFGFYCLLIGYLIFRSTFLPRILGALMVIAGLGWLSVLSPPLAKYLWPYIAAPGLVVEGTLTLWLLVIGVNVQRWKEQAIAAGSMR